MTNHAIYHITHANNLEGIVREGRLWCDARRIERSLGNTNIGYSHIKARRMRHSVTVAAGGMLGNYVPFNFCARSVMLYVVSQGHEDYREGQRPIVHLVSFIERIGAAGRAWFFTDRHADLGYANQYDALEKLGEVNWAVMPMRQWGATRT